MLHFGDIYFNPKHVSHLLICNQKLTVYIIMTNGLSLVYNTFDTPEKARCEMNILADKIAKAS